MESNNLHKKREIRWSSVVFQTKDQVFESLLSVIQLHLKMHAHRPTHTESKNYQPKQVLGDDVMHLLLLPSYKVLEYYIYIYFVIYIEIY